MKKSKYLKQNALSRKSKEIQKKNPWCCDPGRGQLCSQGNGRFRPGDSFFFENSYTKLLYSRILVVYKDF